MLLLYGAIILAVVIVVGTISVTWFSLDRLAFFAVGLLVFTIGWNGVRIAGGAFGDGFFALAAIAVIAYVAFGEGRARLPGWLIATAVIMLIAALVEGIFPPSLKIQNLTELQFIQQFAISGVPITALAVNRSNVTALIKFEIALLVVPFVFSTVCTNLWRINRLLDIWTVSAAINALVGIADRAGFHALAPVAINGDRSAGLTIHPNYLALTCAFAIPTALRWVGRSSRATAAGLFTLLLLIGGEYVTGSRDGNVAAGIGLLLTIAFMPRLRRGLRYVLPLVGVGLTLALAFTNAGHTIVAQMRLGGPTVSTTGSDYQRAVAAHVAEAQIGPRPLAGVGFSVDNDAQNIYLQILAAGGAIAMIGFLVLISGLADSVRRVLGGPLSEEGVAIGICVVVWLVNGYYDSQVADKYLYVLPGILIGCVRVTAMMRDRTPAPLESAADDPVRGPTPRILEPAGAGAPTI